MTDVTLPTRDVEGRVLDGVAAAPRCQAATPISRRNAFRTTSGARIAAEPGDPGPSPFGDAGASIRAARRRFVTVLFTDIVDSTSRAVELGDHRWLELLAAHEAMSTNAVQRFRGRVVRTTGDGMLATFGTAIAGALCAARIARASRDFGIQIRAGLHAGECELHAGQVGGIVFHIGSRIATLAGPGQILMSQTVTAMLIGSGLEWRPCGRRELAGLAGEWDVSELGARAGAVT